MSLNIAAIEKARCPRCGAKPGEKCRSPNGRTVRLPHGARMDEARKRKLWKPS